jgi:hypothetical protein
MFWEFLSYDMANTNKEINSDYSICCMNGTSFVINIIMISDIKISILKFVIKLIKEYTKINLEVAVMLEVQ